jgi:hypothetical protein
MKAQRSQGVAELIFVDTGRDFLQCVTEAMGSFFKTVFAQ